MPRDDRARLGQHFLTDPAVLDRLVRAAELSAGEHALDVGAGDGAITTRLAGAVGLGGHVTAMEIQPSLVAALRSLALPNLLVVEADALSAALPRADAVVANPPFQIAAPLLRKLLDAGFGRALLVLPGELAERLLARPGEERYGKLTVEVALRARIRPLFHVPPGAFEPPPQVRCVVVRVDPRPPPAVDARLLEAVLAAAWESKHRTLRHGLAPLATKLRISSGRITEVLREGGWEHEEPGALSPDDYAELTRALE